MKVFALPLDLVGLVKARIHREQITLLYRFNLLIPGDMSL